WPIHEHLRDFHQIDRWYYHVEGDDGVARVFLRVYRGEDALVPEQYGDEVQSPVLDEARASRKGAAGFVMGRSRLSLRATEPLFGTDGEFVGYLSLGQGVTEMVQRISGQTGDAYAMFLSKELLDRDAWIASRVAAGLDDGWDDRSETVLVATTLADETGLDGVYIDTVPAEAVVLGTTERAGRTFAEGIFPIFDFQEKPVGAVLVLHDITDIAESMRAAQLGLLLAVLVVSLVGAGAVGFTLDRLIFRRLDRVIRFAEDLSLSVVGGEPHPSRRADARDDEIGRFERYLVEYTDTVATALGRRAALQGDEAPAEDADFTADGAHEERTRS
ncbi:MAG: hypothetical protein Q8M66_00845, partial [Actinomycetota bacterium]|nr:hypothetical protein [Actinomycetota bacterium]